MEKPLSTRQTVHWEPRFRTASVKSLQWSAHRDSSRPYGIQTIAWSNRAVSRSANPGLPPSVRMVLSRIRRRPYIRAPWWEGNQLLSGVSSLFFDTLVPIPYLMSQELSSKANLNFITLVAVSCSCAPYQWYSMTLLPGESNYDTFCMPYSSCPRGMTTSVSINEYCATQPARVCSDIPLETEFCQCAYPEQTPVYPDWPGANPTGCEF